MTDKINPVDLIEVLWEKKYNAFSFFFKFTAFIN